MSRHKGLSNSTHLLIIGETMCEKLSVEETARELVFRLNKLYPGKDLNRDIIHQLLFYIQGWHYHCYYEELFKESLYSPEEVEILDSSKIKDELLDQHLNLISDFYGKFTNEELDTLINKESLWEKVVGGITNDEINSYFSNEIFTGPNSVIHREFYSMRHGEILKEAASIYLDGDFNIITEEEYLRLKEEEG
jgi:hypothetical protein